MAELVQHIRDNDNDYTITLVIDDERNQNTPNEGWVLEPIKEYPWYTTAAEFATRILGDGAGKSCLVIGSPLFEAMALQKANWQIIYLDCRMPPSGLVLCIVGDATDMLFPDNSFDAISSTCVLCHAGLGRYGDKVVNDGDRKMLMEMARVMKPNAVAAVTFGPTIIWLTNTSIIKSIHRIYAVDDAVQLAKSVGFEPSDISLSYNGKWIEPEMVEHHKKEYKKIGTSAFAPAPIVYFYLSMKLKKTNAY